MALLIRCDYCNRATPLPTQLTAQELHLPEGWIADCADPETGFQGEGHYCSAPCLKARAQQRPPGDPDRYPYLRYPGVEL